MKKKKYLKINKILDKYNFSNFLAVQNYGIFSGDQNLHKTITIVSLIEQIKNVKGDIIEFGVWNGNTSFLIKKIIDLKKIDKKIYMVDHFKGLQNFSLKDKNAVKHKNKYAGNYHLIKEVINFFNFEKIKIFSNDILNFDFNILKKNKFSLVIIDVDLYKPTKKILDNIHELISLNGMIIFDEGNKKEFTGEKKALDEFYKLHKKKFIKIFLNKKYQPDVILKKIY